jgi:hypothetical protein
MCLAVIAGNWAYYGSIAAVMNSAWALASLATIFVSLATSLLASLIMSEMHRDAFYIAESNWDAWEYRFNRYRNAVEARDPFPATRTIDRLGVFTRIVKAFLPLVAGLMLVIGALCPH